jgi:hypothetical protein
MEEVHQRSRPAVRLLRKVKEILHTLATTQVSRAFAVMMILGTVVVATAVGAAVHMAILVDSLAAQAEAYPIAISSDRLEFGRVPYHGTVVRHLVLRNDGDEPVRAWFFASGAGYSVEPRDVVLQPGVEARVAVSVLADRPGDRLSGELLVHVDDGAGPLVIPLEGRSPAVGETRRETEAAEELRVSKDPGRGGRSAETLSC